MIRTERIKSIGSLPFLYPLFKSFSKKNIIRILAYHRVYDIDEKNYLFDEELISATTSSFKQQMEIVAKNYNVITFYDLTKYIQENKPVPDNCLIITFDDGYFDNYTNAYQILKQLNLRAVFFISTDYIESNDPFWFEYLIYIAKKKLIKNDHEIFKEAHIFDEKNDILEIVKKFRKYLMTIPNQKRIKLLDTLIEYAGICRNSREFNEIRTMNWNNIKEMADNGMEIGSHTKSHLILKNANPDELDDELIGSKKNIENITGKKCASISYPVGNINFVPSENVIEQVKQKKYEWGITYITGINGIPKSNEYNLKRLKIERNVDIKWFKSYLLHPQLFF